MGFGLEEGESRDIIEGSEDGSNESGRLQEHAEGNKGKLRILI